MPVKAGFDIKREINRAKIDTVKWGTLAAGTDDERPVFYAPEKCVITDIKVINATDITQSDTDYDTYTVTNKSTDGTGTDVLVTATTEATGGLDINDFTPTSLGTLSNAGLAAGECLSFDLTGTNLGQGTDEMIIIVEWKSTIHG